MKQSAIASALRSSRLNIIINVCNVYKKIIKAFVIFVNVYYFNKRYMKCTRIKIEIDKIKKFTKKYKTVNT